MLVSICRTLNMSTRSSVAVWLIGHPEEAITGCRLPSKGQVLRHIYYHHTILKKTKSNSASSVIDSVLTFWASANVPISNFCYCKKKLLGLVEHYEKFKKNRLKDSDSYRLNEDMFCGDLEELFDISKRDANVQITNDEDRAFLISQQEDRTQSTMAGVDKLLQRSHENKRKWMESEKKRKEKSDRDKEDQARTLDSSDIGILSSLSSESDDDGDADREFTPTTSRQTSTAPKKVKASIHSFLTPSVTSTLDRVNITDRQAMFAMGAIAKATGQNLDSITLSRRSIRRYRINQKP